jgi:hypothetical protein
MFQQVSEKALREILRIVHSVPAAAHESVKRSPIGLAKLRQRGPRNLRFGLAPPRRENHAPMRQRKQIALTVLVPLAGIHVNAEEKQAAKKIKISCSTRSRIPL